MPSTKFITWVTYTYDHHDNRCINEIWYTMTMCLRSDDETLSSIHKLLINSSSKTSYVFKPYFYVWGKQQAAAGERYLEGYIIMVFFVFD